MWSATNIVKPGTKVLYMGMYYNTSTKKLPKPTHPPPKPPKKYNDYSVKLNMSKWNYKPEGF